MGSIKKALHYHSTYHIMKLIRIIPTLLLLSLSLMSRAQSISKINMQVTDCNAEIRSVELVADNIDLCVDQSGNMALNFFEADEYEYYSHFDGDFKEGKLKSLGGVMLDYYDNFDGVNNRGKLKLIGDIKITYYDQFDGHDNIGRIKAVGNITFTYNNSWDGPDNIGKLSSIGDNKISYYDRFGGSDNIGKLRSIGNTEIAYFDRFDGQYNIGKIKSIKGHTPYLYFIRDTDDR